jgi:hypothetical protein
MLVAPTPGRFASSQLDRAFRAERNEALHRVLRRLPDDFVAPLIEGLEGADVITPGKLFAGESGGCAVGVTLRAMEPSYRGRWLLLGRSRSIRGFRRLLAQRVPHLYALEQVFDRSVVLARARHPEANEAEVALAVARWVADEARAELVLREMKADWLNQAVAGLTALAGPSEDGLEGVDHHGVELAACGAP